MALWMAFAVLTAAVLAALLHPLLRPSARPAAAADADLAVYRDQLSELEAERGRGLIPDAAADAARTEIARRVLASADRATAEDVRTSAAQESRTRTIGLGLAMTLPLAALALYLLVGSPGMPDYPFSARTAPSIDSAGLPQLIARVEARLREHPEDGEGWDVIAPVYLKEARYADAANAFTRAIALLGESPRRLAGLAEASILRHDGIITETARVSYEKLAKLEPSRPEPRFWLAVAQEQDGRLADAIAAYDALLRDAPSDASWRAAVTERRDAARARLTSSSPSAAPIGGERGPNAEDLAAAERMTPEQRTQFITQMVDGLAERLRKDSADLAGWQRLIRAYAVLGRNSDALAALADARRAFANEPPSLAALDALAKSLRIES
jgi:cytochrome c-type biogenesis protein CcmH